MLYFIYNILIWLVGPVCVLSPLYRCMAIIYCLDNPQSKHAAKAGVGAGFTLFVSYLFATQKTDIISMFLSSLDPSGGVIAFAVGCIYGFCLLWLAERWFSSRLIGLLTLFMSAASTIALFTYLFTSNSRAIVTFFAFGIVLGNQVYMIKSSQFGAMLGARSLLGRIHLARQHRRALLNTQNVLSIRKIDLLAETYDVVQVTLFPFQLARNLKDALLSNDDRKIVQVDQMIQQYGYEEKYFDLTKDESERIKLAWKQINASSYADSRIKTRHRLYEDNTSRTTSQLGPN